MDFLLTEQQQAMQELARRIAREKVKPVRARYDEENVFPWDMVQGLARADLFRVFIPALVFFGTGRGHGVPARLRLRSPNAPRSGRL